MLAHYQDGDNKKPILTLNPLRIITRHLWLRGAESNRTNALKEHQPKAKQWQMC